MEALPGDDNKPQTENASDFSRGGHEPGSGNRRISRDSFLPVAGTELATNIGDTFLNALSDEERSQVLAGQASQAQINSEVDPQLNVENANMAPDEPANNVTRSQATENEPEPVAEQENTATAAAEQNQDNNSDRGAEATRSREIEPLAERIGPIPEGVDPEFWIAVPADIQQELLNDARANERNNRSGDQSRNTNSRATAVEVDDRFMLTLPDAREEVLVTSEDGRLGSHPLHFPVNTQTRRQSRRRFFVEDPAVALGMNDPTLGHFRRERHGRDSQGRSRHERHLEPRSREHYSRNNPLSLLLLKEPLTPGSAKSGKSKGALALRDGSECLIDKECVRAALKLLCIGRPLSNKLYLKLLHNLSQYRDFRDELIVRLLSLICSVHSSETSLPKEETKAFIDIARSDSSFHRLYGASWSASRHAVSNQEYSGVPALVTKRALEVLINLSKQDASFARSMMRPTNLWLTNCLRDPLYSAKGKAKENDRAETGLAPLRVIFVLLTEDAIRKNSVYIEQALHLIESILKLAVSLKSFAEKEFQKKQNRIRLIDDDDLLPFLGKGDISQLCDLLSQNGYSELVYTRLCSVMKLLAKCNESHRFQMLTEIKEKARDCEVLVQSELQTLDTSQSLKKAVSEKIVPSSSVALLRIVNCFRDLARKKQSSQDKQEDPTKLRMSADEDKEEQAEDAEKVRIERLICRGIRHIMKWTLFDISVCRGCHEAELCCCTCFS